MPVTVRTSKGDATIDEPKGLSRLSAAIFVLSYGLAAFAVIIALASGRGTKIDAGYIFSDYHTTTHNGTDVVVVEPFLSYNARSTTVADALLSVACALLAFQFLSMLVQWPKGLTTRFVRMATDCAVAPLMIGQSAMWARVADAEKVALLMFLMALVHVAILLLDVDVMDIVASLQQQQPAERKRLVVNEDNVYTSSSSARPPHVTVAITLLCATFLLLWVVVLVNLAWQNQAGNVERHTITLSLGVFGVSLVQFVLSIATIVRREFHIRELLAHGMTAALSALYGWALLY
jgi:hypothetical protein